MMMEEVKTNNKSGSKSRTMFYVAMIGFFVVASGFLFYTARAVTQAGQAVENTTSAVEPITDLVRGLFLPATPVVLPNPATIVHKINDLARLETASYELEKVVTADSESEGLLDFLVGESMVFVGYGKVYAGIDLATMTEEDLVVVDPDTVMVHLPPAMIFEDIPALDNDKSFVADRDTGLLTQADADLETRVRQTAEVAILEAAQGSDILERANFNAQEFMLGFLQGLGFTEVIFTQDIPTDIQPYEQPIPKGYFLSPTAMPENGG